MHNTNKSSDLHMGCYLKKKFTPSNSRLILCDNSKFIKWKFFSPYKTIVNDNEYLYFTWTKAK